MTPHADPPLDGPRSPSGTGADDSARDPATEPATEPEAGLDKLADVELMLRAQADDIEAFETLFRRHERALYNYFARMSRDRVGAEDAVQDVFTRLWSNRHLYRPSGKFTNYIFQIARNYWINEHKRRSIRPTTAPLDAALGFAEDTRNEEQPLSALETKELANEIERALGEIPEDQREVFILARYQELRYQDIADMLAIPVRTVESRLVLATRKLMSKLASYRRLDL